ncbi:MAG TPA: aldo/keto reductase [Patescibacteria group bacterium]|nr:aldo/keto reductase [Patescibacteria group bacterium]
MLGSTDLNVSRMCFGSLTIGPLQANLPLREGAAVIEAALDAGVNFIDTAQLYQTYPYLREALRSHRHSLIVASKSYDYTYEGMRTSVEEACREIGRDYVDIFMLHEQTSRMTLKGHYEALRYLCDAKRQGLIRAAGVSTHTVEVVRAASYYEEIDVIHPLLNQKGLGIMGGTTADMQAAVQEAAAAGKGIFSMKPLGGGHLGCCARESIQWVLNQPGVDAVAIGMQAVTEVAVNCRIFSYQPVEPELMKQLAAQSRRILVQDWCTGCGSCVDHCPAQALELENGQVVCRHERCILCGYCGARCPEFCLKIV